MTDRRARSEEGVRAAEEAPASRQLVTYVPHRVCLRYLVLGPRGPEAVELCHGPFDATNAPELWGAAGSA